MSKTITKTKQAGAGRVPNLIAQPSDFSKLGQISKLGQTPQYKIPTYYYDYSCLDMPLTPAEFAAEFGSTRAIFNCGTDTQVACGRQTNALCGSSVAAPFIATGLCIVAIGEGRSFAIHGASVPTPAVAGSSQPVLPLADGLETTNYDGVVDIAAANATGANANSATMWWGGPGHLLIEKYFQAFRLQVAIQRRFLFVDEALQDVGMCWTPPEFEGASNSQIPTQAFIRAVNDVLREKGIGQTFLPANNGPGGTPDCLPPPLAGVTYGHPKIVGLSNRIYCFPQPLLLLPGMRFDINFVPIEDEACFRALESVVTANCQGLDENFGSLVSGVAATASCGITCSFPGGRVCLGVVLKGYELWPSACVEYIQNFVFPGTMAAAMVADNQYLQGHIRNKMQNLGDPQSPQFKHLEGVLGTKPRE